MDADETEINALRRRYHMQELQRMRYQLKRFTTNDFESLAVVGKGAFGEVWDHVSTLYVFYTCLLIYFEEFASVLHFRQQYIQYNHRDATLRTRRSA